MRRSSDDATRRVAPSDSPGERHEKPRSHNDDDADDENGYSGGRARVRLLFFLFRFSTGCLVPQMSLYMRSTGMDAGTIGRLQAIRPLATLVCAPFW